MDGKNVNYNADWVKIILDACPKARMWPHGQGMLHHKFIVFANYDLNRAVKPYAVWTGSSNFTYNSQYNQESGLYIVNDELSAMYYNNFQCLWNKSISLKMI